MELWFYLAVGAMFLMGLGNFTFKLAAKRGYNGAVFSLYGALTTFPIIYIAVLLFSSTAQFSWVAFMAG